MNKETLLEKFLVNLFRIPPKKITGTETIRPWNIIILPGQNCKNLLRVAK